MNIKIEHSAIWIKGLAKTKDFSVRYFDMVCGEQYHNPTKQFTTYFLSFRNSNVRINVV
ncbi:MAG: hypothetical protein HC819_02775 [Cyclobacteriaceae bacterium]|nr:hypothetical protein [Cyclobacteriaceae bacterium]